MEKEDEVQALRRELEQLRAQLDKQRSGGLGGSGSGGGSDSSAQVEGAELQDPLVKKLDGSFRVVKPQQWPSPSDTSPLRADRASDDDDGATLRGVSFRDGPPRRSVESEFINHVHVDTKRGKWWLKDRQVLSRNVLASDADAMVVKVRETWLWSGRTVTVDKIVTVPLHEEHDTSRRAAVDIEDRRPPEVVSDGGVPQPQQSSGIASRVDIDSKQLGKEFVSPAPSNESIDDNESGHAASTRMEMEMALSMELPNVIDGLSDFAVSVQQAPESEGHS